MVRLKDLKKALLVISLHLICFFVFLYAYREGACLRVYQLLFLNYDRFNDFGFLRFDISLLVLNFFMFFLYLHSEINEVIENNSFLSMKAQTMSKKDLISKMLKDVISKNLKYLFWSFLGILLSAFIGDLISVGKIILLPDLTCSIFLYLVKYFIWISAIIFCLRISACIRSITYEEFLPYIFLSLCIVIDYLMDTHLLRLCNSVWKNGCSTLLVLGAAILVISIIINKVYRSKEIFYD